MHPNFLAALFITGEICKQPKWPMINELIKKVYMMKYYSTIKMNESLPFERTWTDLEGIMLSEMSRQIPHDFTCV